MEKLLAAAREGRLYVEEHEKGVSEEEIKKEVRAYVARVKAFVTKDFRQSAAWMRVHGRKSHLQHRAICGMMVKV